MARRREADAGATLDAAPFTGLHWLAIALLAVTGTVHVYLFATQEFVPFLLAGLGFFGAIGVLLADFYRRLVYLALVPYTIAQIVGWYVLDGDLTAIAVVDKVAQVLLLVLLVYLFWRDGWDGSPLL